MKTMISTLAPHAKGPQSFRVVAAIALLGCAAYCAAAHGEAGNAWGDPMLRADGFVAKHELEGCPSHFDNVMPQKATASASRTARLTPAKVAPLVWYVNADAQGANNGMHWADAFTSLQDALGVAQSGEEVWVAAGTYTPVNIEGDTPTGSERHTRFLVPDGVGVYGGFSGDEVLRSERNSNPALNATVLSGDLLGNDEGPAGEGNATMSENSVVLIDFEVAPFGTVLDGFTITGATGGAIDAHHTTHPTLRNLKVVDNGARQSNMWVGIGVGCGGTLTMENVVFARNTGTFVLWAEETGPNMEFTLRNVHFRENSGNGAVLEYVRTATLHDVSFINNGGRGLSAWGSTISISNGAFIGNSDTGVSASGGSTTIVSTVVLGNFSTEFGGHGGGLVLGGSTRLANVLVAGNVAKTRGGGIFMSTQQARQWSNVTITGNRAGTSGGAIFAVGSITGGGHQIANSIIYGNESGDGGPPIVYGEGRSAYIAWRANIIEGAEDEEGGWNASYGVDEGANLDIDPFFVDPRPPAAAPNAEGHYAVRPGSPAWNSGDNAYLPADWLDIDGDGDIDETLPWDIAGMRRILHGTVNRGAYESAGARHSADRGREGTFTLSDALRVIQLYNAGGYHCDPDGEDGYAPGPEPEARDCAPHSSDYKPQDWRIGLSELLRLIQLFTFTAYHPCPDADPPTEDGFCPGAP